MTTELACKMLQVKIIRVGQHSIHAHWAEQGYGDLVDTAEGLFAELVHNAQDAQPAVLYLEDVSWLVKEKLLETLLLSIQYQINPYDKVLVLASCEERDAIFSKKFCDAFPSLQFVLPEAVSLEVEDVEKYLEVWLQSRFRKRFLGAWDALVESNLQRHKNAEKNRMAASDSLALPVVQKIAKTARELAIRIQENVRLGLLDDLRQAVRRLEDLLSAAPFEKKFLAAVETAFKVTEGRWTKQVYGSGNIGMSGPVCDRFCERTNGLTTTYKKFIEDLRKKDSALESVGALQLK
jgi:hypothetical protein